MTVNNSTVNKGFLSGLLTFNDPVAQQHYRHYPNLKYVNGYGN